MKAVRVIEWGKPVHIDDIPKPNPGDDEVLVKIHAASINPFDAAVMAGYLSFMTATPLTLGTDYSGEAVAVGKDITHVKPGDEVYGSIPARVGTFAEYTTPNANEIARKPKSLDHIYASTVPLAKNKGAYIYGTDISEKTEHVAALGIDRFIDISKERFEDVVENVDLVLDYIGGEIMERSYNVLKPGGRYVTSLVLDPPQEEAIKRGISSKGLRAYPRTDVLAEIANMIDAGKLKVFVNRTFPLEEAQSALEYRYMSKAPGKVVLTVL